MVIGFRFIILCAIGISTFALTLGGVIMIKVKFCFIYKYILYNIYNKINYVYPKQKAPFIVKVQFITLILTLLTEIYIYTWPADHMKDMVNYILI